MQKQCCSWMEVGYIRVWCNKGRGVDRNPDMTDCAVCGPSHCCHGDSVTHSSLIWILELCSVWCVTYVRERVQKCTCLNACTHLGMKINKTVR